MNRLVIVLLTLAAVVSDAYARTDVIAEGRQLCTHDRSFCLKGRLTHNRLINTLTLDARIPTKQHTGPGQIRLTLKGLRTNGELDYFTLAVDTEGKSQGFVDLKVIPPSPPSTEWQLATVEFIPEVIDATPD